MRFPLLLSFLFLYLLPCAAPAQWQSAKPGWDYQFPKDHGSHPGFKTEWWYFTGNLRHTGGLEFGYQLTFFRQGILDSSLTLPASRFVQRDVKFAHFAVSDISRKMFYHFQKLSRGAFGESGFDDGARIAWIDNWCCERTGVDEFHLKAAQDGVSIDLMMTSPRPPVIHGRGGVSQKSEGEGRASHYYSLTRLQTRGTVSIHGVDYLAEGLTWFDHEWATNQLAANQSGWDWFSMQFEEGGELMLFQIRKKEGGRDPFSSGTFVDASGVAHKIGVEDFALSPIEWWTSPDSKGRYPVAWKIKIPAHGVDVVVRARFEKQELAAAPFAYWEGSVSVDGSHTGRGYLEMTGYAGRIIGMQAQ
ncbi:MAG: lipocalin-like domain-containing protein [bacterium]